MKRWKLPPLITLTISAQMIVSPFAYGQQGGMNALQIINTVGQSIQQAQQAQMAQQQAIANQQLVAQMTAPGPDKYFNDALFARIPGFYAYLAQTGGQTTVGCTTLPTTLTEVRSEVCRIGITGDRGVPPQAQLGEMFSMYKTYGDVAKAYENYSSDSNAAGQGFGVGCMKNVMNALNGFLTSRINDLDKLQQNVAFINDKFKNDSKTDLDAIAEATAVLDGNNSELANEVSGKSGNKDLFNYGARFNNAACKSMYAGDAINNKGRSGGLNAIAKDMRNQFSTKSGKFSGESYVGAHATVIEDINKMADNVAKQFNLNFTSATDPERPGYGQFLSSLRQGAVNSSTGLTSQLTNDFFADAQQSFTADMNKISSDVNLLKDELSAAGVQPERALGIARNLNSTNFDSEVTLVQNQIRNSCVQRAFGGAGFWNDLKKNIKDPDASKFANKSYSNFRDRIQQIMTDPRTTPESKLDAVRALESSEGQRFVLNMQGGYQASTVDAQGNVVKRNVNASADRPSAYFQNVVSTCDAQYNTNKLGSTLTAAGAIQKLRNLNQQYKSLAQAQASKLSSEIRRKLINCNNATEASNEQNGSCTPDRFNTTSAGFCANAAFTCANNMKACTTQAEQIVSQIKTERSARVQKYKQNMEKNKNDIKNMIGRVFSDYSQLGQAIIGMNLGAGFNFPAPDLNVSGEYMDKFKSATANSPDGQLLLEDPDKYVDLMKRNIDKLKGAFQQMQNQLTGGAGLLAQHIIQTQKNYTDASRKATDISNQCIAKHDQFVQDQENQRRQMAADQQRRMNELGEKRRDFCNRFGSLDTNPNAVCNGNVIDTISGANAAGSYEAGRIGRVCARVQSESPSGEGSGSGNMQMAVANICARYQGGEAGTPRSGTTPPSAVTATGADALKVYCARFPNPEGFCTPVQGGTDTRPTTSYNCDALYLQIVTLGRSLNPTGTDRALQTADSGDDTSGAPSICTDNRDRYDGSGEQNNGSGQNINTASAVSGT